MKSIDTSSKTSITFIGVTLCGSPTIVRTASTVASCDLSLTMGLLFGAPSRLHEGQHEAVARAAPLACGDRRVVPVARVRWIAQRVALRLQAKAGRLDLLAQCGLLDPVQRLHLRK